jgi:hypothetical protein
LSGNGLRDVLFEALEEPEQPIYGIRSQALLGKTIALMSVEELAAYYWPKTATAPTSASRRNS